MVVQANCKTADADGADRRLVNFPVNYYAAFWADIYHHACDVRVL